MISRKVVRPPGFEFPDHRLRDGLPGRWVGSPLDASRYVLDQARLRPHRRGERQAGFFYLTLDPFLIVEVEQFPSVPSPVQGQARSSRSSESCGQLREPAEAL